jgi:AcrR family transcriptional regulator
MLESADVTPPDGRAARSHRTRAAIVDGLIALLERGHVQPTVEEIAAEAGVAPRTVFQHYADRDALFAALAARRRPRAEELMAGLPAGGAVVERIDALVAQRARVYEWIAPVRRAALLMEPFSESVQARVAAFRARKRREAIGLFAQELSALGPEERSAAEAALAALTSYAAWDALRTQQGRDVEQASAALTAALRGLLGA